MSVDQVEMPVQQRARLLVVDNEEPIRFVLREVMEKEGYVISEAGDGEEAVKQVREREFDLVIMDIKMPKMDGIEALKQIKALRPHVVVVMITAFGSEQVAQSALRAGAYDYFRKPFEVDELRVVVRRALERARMMRQITLLRSQLSDHQPFERIIGNSPEMQEVVRMVEQVAPTDATTLILGESGTGKELVAEAIHRASERQKGPLIKLNCAAIPESLLESELFGHEKGAFTGAVAQRMGKFELAEGGTIFLDEIGEMPASLQSKLLRVLQEKEIERVGGMKTIGIDVRLIAGTNRDLEAEVAAGKFREDLFFRLNVIPIRVPPVRERGDDVPLLAEHFLQIYSQRFQKEVVEISPAAQSWMRQYPWPGNVREMENVIQRAVLLTSGRVLEMEHLPQTGSSIANPLASLIDPSVLTQFDVPLGEKLESVSDAIEAAAIKAALDKADGKRQEAAKLLGISRKSLFNKMSKYHLFE